MRPTPLLRFITKLDRATRFVLIIFAIVFVVTLAFVKPMQDDYVSLRDVSSLGFIGSVFSMWQNWGGNVSTIAISNFFINIYTANFYFIGIALHSIVTVLLMLSAFRLLKLFFQDVAQVDKSIKTSSWILFSFLCFGSLHAPGFISVLNFTLASTAHLWPTLIFIHCIYLSKNKTKFHLLMALPLGFLVCNTNIAEAIFCLIITLSILFFYKSQLVKSLNIHRKTLCYLLIGQFSGLLTIVLSPGFAIRSSIVVEPVSVLQLAFNFFEALVFNLGDIFLHPGWVLAFLSGFISKSSFISRKALLNYLRLNLYVIFICVVTISAGDAFAYPSWYHTMSFYVFIFPIFFTFGILARHRLVGFRKSSIFFGQRFFLALCLLLLTRDLIMLGIRADHWNQDYETNRLQIEKNNFDLVGYNINYWPLGLGLDDVELWDWINSAYVDWAQNIRG